MIKSETRASVIKFLQLMVAHHPSRRLVPTLCARNKYLTLLFLHYLDMNFCLRCRRGSANVLVNFDDLCPSDMLLGESQECVVGSGNEDSNFQICGKEVPRGYWVGIQYHFFNLMKIKIEFVHTRSRLCIFNFSVWLIDGDCLVLCLTLDLEV